MSARGHGRSGARDVYGREDVALLTPEEAAAADQAAREVHGIGEGVLMESAGRAAAAVVDRLFPRGRILALAGSGNNGGDALVMARALRIWGREVTVHAAGPRAPNPALRHGHDIAFTDAGTALDSALACADVLVDGLLGTGASGPARPPYDAIIAGMNGSGRPIVALDLPSGIDALTGMVPGQAVRASATIAFGWPKLGCLLNPARAHCGRLIAVEIGFPPLDPDRARRAALITPDWAAARVPPRPPDAHKSTAGRLAILAGQAGMAGAAALTAEAARRAGAGLIRIASDAANRQILQTLVPEATFVDRTALEASDIGSAHALVAGPGIGAAAEVRPLLDQALRLTGDVPVLLDADALNLFAADPDALAAIARRRPVIVTPHPKELERLADASLDRIQADRVAAARTAADRFGCVVLLKGQPSLVAAPDGTLLVTSAGSSDLATGGMGDQLAGVIGALLAAGAAPLDAAGAGLYLAARAADLARRGRSLGPRDVSDHFHLALARPGARRSALRLPFVTFDQPPRW